jgi:mRNA-degrading endonuclease HigB of HigAB toxin-antitoxin module
MDAGNWATPNDVKAQYGPVRIFAYNCLIFNTIGYIFRLIVKVNHTPRIVEILFIGTHTE